MVEVLERRLRQQTKRGRELEKDDDSRAGKEKDEDDDAKAKSLKHFFHRLWKAR